MNIFLRRFETISIWNAVFFWKRIESKRGIPKESCFSFSHQDLGGTEMFIKRIPKIYGGKQAFIFTNQWSFIYFYTALAFSSLKYFNDVIKQWYDDTFISFHYLTALWGIRHKKWWYPFQFYRLYSVFFFLFIFSITISEESFCLQMITFILKFHLRLKRGRKASGIWVLIWYPCFLI